LKGKLLKLLMGILVAWAVTTLYRVNLDHVVLEQRLQGVREYSIFQYRVKSSDENLREVRLHLLSCITTQDLNIKT
jgi:hypothetical protein